MRIQSINQNNYQNRNIGFKKNSTILIEGLNCEYSELCAPSKRVLLDGISDFLVRYGFLKLGEHFKLRRLQDIDTRQTKFIILDSKTIKAIDSAPTDKEKDIIFNIASILATPCELSAKNIFQPSTHIDCFKEQGKGVII